LVFGASGGAGGGPVDLGDGVALPAAQPDAHEVATVAQVAVQLLHLQHEDNRF